MYRHFILESYHSQYRTAQLINDSPETKPIPLLRLHSKRVLQNANTPFFFEIRTLAQHLLFKVLGEFVFHYCIIAGGRHNCTNFVRPNSKLTAALAARLLTGGLMNLRFA